MAPDTKRGAVKQRIEAAYERDEATPDTGHDHVGQMTIAFCYEDPASCWPCSSVE